jgi:hypothetical protein
MASHWTRFLVLTLFIAQMSCWIRLDEVKCLSSNKTVASNYSCYIKKIGNREASVNIEVFTEKDINFVLVSALTVVNMH